MGAARNLQLIDIVDRSHERAIEVARQRHTVPIDASRDDPQRYFGPNWVEAAIFNALIKLVLANPCLL